MAATSAAVGQKKFISVVRTADWEWRLSSSKGMAFLDHMTPVDVQRSLEVGTDELYRLSGSSAEWAIDVDNTDDYNRYYYISRPLTSAELSQSDPSVLRDFPVILLP